MCELNRLRGRVAHRSRFTVGIETHSRKTLPAGANGSPLSLSMNSVTRSRGSYTTRRRALSSKDARNLPASRTQG